MNEDSQLARERELHLRQEKDSSEDSDQYQDEEIQALSHTTDEAIFESSSKLAAGSPTKKHAGTFLQLVGPYLVVVLFIGYFVWTYLTKDQQKIFFWSVPLAAAIVLRLRTVLSEKGWVQEGTVKSKSTTIAGIVAVCALLFFALAALPAPIQDAILFFSYVYEAGHQLRRYAILGKRGLIIWWICLSVFYLVCGIIAQFWQKT